PAPKKFSLWTSSSATSGARRSTSAWCGARRPMPAPGRGGRPATLLRRALAGVAAAGRELAAQLLAGAARHHFPVRRVVVASGLPGARMARRPAVVLARLGD